MLKSNRIISLLFLTFIFSSFLSCSQLNKVIVTKDLLAVFRKTASGYSGGVVYGGYPDASQYPNQLRYLDRKVFIVAYDEVRACPAWVAYRVKASVSHTAPKRPTKFFVDEETTALIHPNDYTGSGYDRGHMAPNFAIGSRYGAIAQKETFKMSNIVPQKPKLNRGPWRELEWLEAKEGGYGDTYECIWVICGPIWSNDADHIKGKVEIPIAFFKIIIAIKNGQPKALAFIMQQNATDKQLFLYLVSIDTIEDLTGFDFMPQMHIKLQTIIEQNKPDALWRINDQ